MEKKNIFEGAKFPDVFMLRCGMPAVFVRKTEYSVEFIYQPKGTIYSGLVVYPNGRYSYYGEEHELDVIDKYHDR